MHSIHLPSPFKPEIILERQQLSAGIMPPVKKAGNPIALIHVHERIGKTVMVDI